MARLHLSDLPASATLTGLLDVVGTLEHAQLDFKRQPAKLNELIPAMAMTDGGLIVIGIADDRTVYGCQLTQKVLDQITRAGKDVAVEVQAREVEVDGEHVVVVGVPEVRQRIVTTTDGRLLRRVGSETVPLVGDQLARFVRERSDVPGEEQSVNGVDGSTFERALINQALAADDKPAVPRVRYLRALVDLGVALPQPAPLDPTVTVAAVVMFATDPQSHVPGASVQLVRRAGVGPGPGPTSARQELTGPLPKLLDECLRFVEKHTTSYEVVIGARRERWSQYPTEVLREALLNALAHRDYARTGSTVDVTLRDDRIEIKSPGGLPGPITLDNIRSEHYSRNRRIMRALKQLHLVEEYGEGVERMFDLMEARLMDPPIFTATPDSVTVTLHNRFNVSIDDQAWLALLAGMHLTNHERRLLVSVRREGSITRRRAAALVPDGDAETLLRTAVAKGLLVRAGERGGAFYELSDEVVLRAGRRGVEARARMRQTLADEIARAGSLSTPEAAQMLNEDPVTLRQLLNDLSAAGVIEARGRTRARRYYAVSTHGQT